MFRWLIWENNSKAIQIVLRLLSRAFGYRGATIGHCDDFQLYELMRKRVDASSSVLPRPLIATRSVSEGPIATRSVSEGTCPDSLRQLFAEPNTDIAEARTKDYALLGKIDYQSPVFRPFAIRVSNFSKISVLESSTGQFRRQS